MINKNCKKSLEILPILFIFPRWECLVSFILIPSMNFSKTSFFIKTAFATTVKYTVSHNIKSESHAEMYVSGGW